MSSDFHLPDEILSVIPTDPFDQLDVARKITAMAISSRVSDLDAEVGRLRERVSEKDRVVGELREEVARLETRFREADARAKAAVEDNVKLCREREMLTLTVKRLNGDLAKLENFKKQLMQSLGEDNSSHQAESINSGTYEQSSPKASLKDAEVGVCATSDPFCGSAEKGNTFHASSLAEQMYSLTPYISPRYTPAATPKVISSSTSPRGYSPTGSPKGTSGVTSPTKARIDGKTMLSPWYPSSQQSSSANSPPRGHVLPGRTTRIDGKEFFRQARNQLSYEQFGAFLANIKEFNARKQSREETLEKAYEIFGTENKDLYASFQGMLNHNLP